MPGHLPLPVTLSRSTGKSLYIHLWHLRAGGGTGGGCDMSPEVQETEGDVTLHAGSSPSDSSVLCWEGTSLMAPPQGDQGRVKQHFAEGVKHCCR